MGRGRRSRRVPGDHARRAQRSRGDPQELAPRGLRLRPGHARRHARRGRSSPGGPPGPGRGRRRAPPGARHGSRRDGPPRARRAPERRRSAPLRIPRGGRGFERPDPRGPRSCAGAAGSRDDLVRPRGLPSRRVGGLAGDRARRAPRLVHLRGGTGGPRRGLRPLGPQAAPVRRSALPLRDRERLLRAPRGGSHGALAPQRLDVVRPHLPADLPGGPVRARQGRARRGGRSPRGLPRRGGGGDRDRALVLRRAARGRRAGLVTARRS